MQAPLCFGFPKSGPSILTNARINGSMRKRRDYSPDEGGKLQGKASARRSQSTQSFGFPKSGPSILTNARIYGSMRKRRDYSPDEGGKLQGKASACRSQSTQSLYMSSLLVRCHREKAKSRAIQCAIVPVRGARRHGSVKQSSASHGAGVGTKCASLPQMPPSPHAIDRRTDGATW